MIRRLLIVAGVLVYIATICVVSVAVGVDNLGVIVPIFIVTTACLAVVGNCFWVLVYWIINGHCPPNCSAGF